MTNIYKILSDKKLFVYLQMSAKTLGWVGFGISPNGGMKGSDMVIGWVDSAADVFVLVGIYSRKNMFKIKKIENIFKTSVTCHKKFN